MAAATRRASATERTRAPNRAPDEVRAMLVAATVELLSEGPASGVTVRAIAERAGVQHSLITRHFSSKDQLVAAALGQIASEYTESVAAADDPVEGYLRALAHLRANPTAAAATSAAVGTTRTGDAPEDRFPGYAAHLAQLLAAGAPDDDHTRLVAGATFALVAGWSVLEANLIEAGDLGHLGRAAIEAELRGIVGRLIERETEPPGSADRPAGRPPAPRARRSRR